MNEENNGVENQETKNYSYHFNPDENVHEDIPNNEEENTYQQEGYTGGYQQNYGKTLVKTLGGKSSSMMRNPYGIRGPWNSGKVSVLGMVIILVILLLFGFAIFMFR